ncbi:MAG TPA: hypothetical protein VGQ09_12535 [Chitinophagaceae bacterium]|jgi:hypothetical protein|nr:hypothetical protein [Chitinophagaceae bacterium]
MLNKWLTILLQEYRKRKARQQLRWQAILSEKGIGMRTTILEVKEQGAPFADYVQCSVQARLRINGKTVSRWVHTMLTREKMLRKGDVVHIRYHPSHLYSVLIID